MDETFKNDYKYDYISKTYILFVQQLEKGIITYISAFIPKCLKNNFKIIILFVF